MSKPGTTDRASDPRSRSPGTPLEQEGFSPFPIVGVGASAGGLDAFKALLAALPADSGMALILVQHLDPHHDSQLTELLGRSTALPVCEATQGLAVEPDHVYVIPPNANLAITQGRLVLTPRGEVKGPHLPIDVLFRSLADAQQARAIGIVLSGTGSDGTLGLCEIKSAGGITFAQDEASAGQPGMPRSARDSGCVDRVLPIEEIARSLVELASHPYLAEDAGLSADDHGEEAAFRTILDTVRAARGVDFHQYRDTTIRRRILRRMAIHRQDRLVDYAQTLEDDRDEVEALYHDLLIHVTSFFRDPGLFETLKEKVYPRIAEGRPPNAPIRVWVPGCSTGQEAYSIAMTLLEFFDDRGTRPPIQIFATDLTDQTTLDKARAGVYPQSIEGEVSPERLRRFFRQEDHVYRVDKSLRDLCVFARQNMVADPPFSHLDLISCRNVLIYLAPPMHRRLMPIFHYALDPPGFLVLGSAESVGDEGDLFDVVDRNHRIYRKRPGAGRPVMRLPVEGQRPSPRPSVPGIEPPPAGLQDVQREADRLLLGRFTPPGVLIDENMDVVQYRGRTSFFLETPPGEPTANVLKLAREGLLIDLRNAIEEVRRTNQASRREGVRVRGDGTVREIALEVLPVRPFGGGAGCALVLFRDAAGMPAVDAIAPETGDPSTPHAYADDLTRLRHELAATREYMQALAEQQDAANEELRAANEETRSTNEELQSTNEEMQTAKEELQSANEELATVNEELQQRNSELNQLNGDMVNLQTSTTIPVVMVDRDLRIRRFTGPARKVLHLVATDVGRPISDLTLPVRIPEISAVVGGVIETGHARELELQDREGRWYAVRIHSYRGLDDRADGAVLVFVDVDLAKKVEGMLRDVDRRKDIFLATLAHELRNPMAPIRNAVEILKLAGDDPTATGRARDVLERQVGQLSRIIDDLIDVGRIIEGKVELQRRRVAVSAVIELAVETSRSLIQANGHRLTVSVPPSPLIFNVDAGRITQAVVNLLNNAAKYMARGGRIWLTAEQVHSRRRFDAPADEVRITVRDSGVGIAPELMPQIFDMFTQGERVYEHTIGGLGVGLSLVRSLVGMHSGRVEASSAGVGQGSEFTIYLPLAPAGPDPLPLARGPAPPLLRPEVRPRRILVVDDSLDQVESLSMLLQLNGHEVFSAMDGTSAIEAALLHRPDVALVDIGLPGTNGYEVARRIRLMPELAGIVLVAQTGWGQEEDRRRSLEAGFDHHLVKPVELETLERILVAPTPPRADAGPASAPPDAH
jgi:two-component system CheB/CheR fusion protein